MLGNLYLTIASSTFNLCQFDVEIIMDLDDWDSMKGSSQSSRFVVVVVFLK